MVLEGKGIGCRKGGDAVEPGEAVAADEVRERVDGVEEGVEGGVAECVNKIP